MGDAGWYRPICESGPGFLRQLRVSMLVVPRGALPGKAEADGSVLLSRVFSLKLMAPWPFAILHCRLWSNPTP